MQDKHFRFMEVNPGNKRLYEKLHTALCFFRCMETGISAINSSYTKPTDSWKKSQGTERNGKGLDFHINKKIRPPQSSLSFDGNL